MWCAKCGSQMQPEERFCKNCGNPAKAPDAPTGSFYEAPPAPKRRAPKALDMKKLLPVLLISAAVIAVGVLAWAFGPSLLSNSNALSAKGSVMIFKTDSKSIISLNNVLRDRYETYDITDIPYMQQSLDSNTVAAIIRNDQADETLFYMVTSHGNVNLYDVSKNVYSFMMADSGNGIAYIRDFDTQSQTGTLYLYDCAAKKSEKIADGVYSQQGLMYGCISPDGNAIAYITDLDNQNMTFTGHLKAKGRAQEDLGQNILPTAMSNGGGYIYYYEIKGNEGGFNADFYVRKGKENTKLATLTNSNSNIPVFFNADRTQIIFNIDGKAYITKNGAGKDALYSDVKRILLPQYAQVKYINNPTGEEYVYGLKDFTNFALESNDGALLYSDSGLSTETITGDAKQSAVSDDGKTVLFIDSSDKLQRYAVNGSVHTEEIATGVSQFTASKAGSNIYYIDQNNTLYFTSGSVKSKLIADDVSRISLSADGNSLYFISEYQDGSGMLYVTRDGGKPARISDDAYGVLTTASGDFYFSNYDSGNSTFDVYYKAGGEFKEFQGGVTSVN